MGPQVVEVESKGQGRDRGRSTSDAWDAHWLAQVMRQASNDIHCSMHRGPRPGDRLLHHAG